MKPSEAAEILTLASAYDRRTVGEVDAAAWARALSGLSKDECMAAVAEHYTQSAIWLMPAHVCEVVRRVRRARIAAVSPELLEPDDVDPDDVPAYLAATKRRRIALARGDVLESAERLRYRPVGQLLDTAIARLPKMPKVG